MKKLIMLGFAVTLSVAASLSPLTVKAECIQRGATWCTPDMGVCCYSGASTCIVTWCFPESN